MCDEKTQGGMEEAQADESCCSQVVACCSGSGKPVRLLIRVADCCEPDAADAEADAGCGCEEDAADKASGCCIEVQCISC